MQRTGLRTTVGAMGLYGLLLGGGIAATPADELAAAVKGGNATLTARYRYEHVDDDARGPSGDPLREADASTVRLTLGYATLPWHSFSFAAEIEHISEIGPDDFNNGSNGKTDFASVIDPEGTEVNEAYVAFTREDALRIALGRQKITYRKAPLHRFVGTILWRQNWQTFDALSVTAKPQADLAIRYAYLWQVNRIFGDDAPAPLSEFESDSHLVNVQFTHSRALGLEGYAYLLDFDNAPAFSTKTFGVRLTGQRPLTGEHKLVYAGEFAHQADHAGNPAAVDAEYYLLQGGVVFAGLPVLDTLTAKVSREVLSGNGGSDRFVTILGTNHAFQGTADRFLITPGDGIEDTYADLVGQVGSLKIVVSYHHLEADNDGYDYGDEVDLLLTYRFDEHYSLGLKYADYEADRNATNLTRNPAQSADKTVFWAFASARF